MVWKKYNILHCLVNAGFFSYLFTIYKFAAGFPGPCVTELNSNQAVYDVSALATIRQINLFVFVRLLLNFYCWQNLPENQLNGQVGISSSNTAVIVWSSFVTFI